MEAKYSPLLNMLFMVSVAMAVIGTYYYSYGLWYGLGLTGSFMHRAMSMLHDSGLMEKALPFRLACLAFASFGLMVKGGADKDTPWRWIIFRLTIGATLFLTSGHFGDRTIFCIASISGYAVFCIGAILVGRRLRGFDPDLDDRNDTFEQCERLVENQYSVNIPMRYQYKRRMRKGWINIVSPFKAVLVIGIAGSGKSYAVYGPFIHQMIRKGYSMFVYDYKYPDLTRIVYNELLDSYDCYDIKPKMYCVNFDDPEHSHRFNPISAKYLKAPADATEVADLIMKNASKAEKGKDDFFSMSAKSYVDLLIWFLRIYEDGRYCTFPHMVELMGQNYRDVFDVIRKYTDNYPELLVKLNTFADAIKDKAMEQLQGQIASARIPLSIFCDPSLSWILSGEDFTLDINNPQEPKIVCVGNNPDRQQLYGTTLALLTSRMFKEINHKGRRHSAVLIDELPTIYLKGLDNLINTARDKKVATVIGAQDKSQIVRDYNNEDAEVIFNSVGNLFSGAVRGKTAEDLSKSFGKELKESRSFQSGDTSQSTTLSHQMRDVLPRQRIESLSQGSFCGYVTDTFSQKIQHKYFCGEIIVDHKPEHNEDLPQMTFFESSDIDQHIRDNQKRIHLDIVNLLTRELSAPPTTS